MSKGLRLIINIIIAIAVIYLVLLIGPVASFDIPTITTELAKNPLQFVQFLLIGISNGAIFALIALGYTMVYGIIELINFAHGDVFMVGVFTSLTVLSLTGTLDSTNPAHIIFGLIVALLLAIVVCGVLNAAVERLAYRRLRNAPRLAPLITAIGMSFIIENFGLIWAGQAWLVPSFGTSGGAAQKNFPDIVATMLTSVHMNPNLFASTGIHLRLTLTGLLVIVLAGLMMLGLRFFIQRTTLGKAMRATSQNRDAAKMMGIDIDTVISATFLIGGGLAGAAGLMSGLYNNTAWWFMGFRAGLFAFTAAVLGGIGNIEGAMAGGFIIGLVASFSDGYLDARWTEAWIFAILVLILMFRPTGLFGEQVGEKA
ncbi:MAG TPA: branched-chain amino acid ABC transporter permease [Anaerolineales bacterium]|nr:branched-chain amino acid ABC transporter permease [Anaerolineales bacterium]